MKKQPIVISKVEIKEVIDLGFSIGTVATRKPRISQYRVGSTASALAQFNKRMKNEKRKQTAEAQKRNRKGVTFLPHRNLTEHRSKPHTEITSQSPRHC